METLTFMVWTAILWMLSFSVLLPFVTLLYFMGNLRKKWFSFFFTKILGPTLGPKMRPNRKRAFELLKEYSPRGDPSIPLQILEIGIGAGSNLEFYPENSDLTALDMNATFERYFRENRKKFPHVTYKKTVINFAEEMSDVSDASFDIVVSTYVLCSVENVESVISEVKRVLKPGGKYVFVEHVAFPKSGWKYIAQLFVAPIWKIYFDGCCPYRDISNIIYQTGFKEVQCERNVVSGLPLPLQPQIVGIATR